MARLAGALAFILDLAAGGMLEAWTPFASGWIWAGVAAVAAVGMVICLWWDRKQKKKSALGPEIWIDDTTSYREQPDGSRIVTKRTLAKPVRLRTRAVIQGGGGVNMGGKKKPPADGDGKPQ